MDVSVTARKRCFMQAGNLMRHRIDECRAIDRAFTRHLRLMIDKYASQGIGNLVAKKLVLIVGFWLLFAAFIMRDMQDSLLFVSILFILYIIVVMLIYDKIFSSKEPETLKPWQRSNALWARTEQSEQCIRLTIYKRR